MKTAKGSIIMSVQEVKNYGEPERVNESLKLLLSKFAKKDWITFQILQGQKRSTAELLDLLEVSINVMKEELQTSSMALKRAQMKIEEIAQMPLV